METPGPYEPRRSRPGRRDWRGWSGPRWTARGVKLAVGWVLASLVLILLLPDAAESLIVRHFRRIALYRSRFPLEDLMPEEWGWAIVAVVLLAAAASVAGLLLAGRRSPRGAAGGGARDGVLGIGCLGVLVATPLLVAAFVYGGAIVGAWRSLEAVAVADATADGVVVERTCGSRSPGTSAVEFVVDGRTYRAPLSSCAPLGSGQPVLFLSGDPSVSSADTTPDQVLDAADKFVGFPAIIVALGLPWLSFQALSRWIRRIRRR